MKILVQGIGGIGGVIAAELARSGAEPVLVTGNPAITQAISDAGLRVSIAGSRFDVRCPAWTSAAEIPNRPRFDAALLLMKANGVVEAALQVLPFIQPESGFVVTFQNGIVEDSVGDAIGVHRVVSGIIGWGGTMHAPGVYERTSGGETVLGEPEGRATPRVLELARILRPLGRVDVCQNMRGALWSKLAINCTITTLGALTGQTLGEMLESAAVRRVFLGVYREVVETAEVQGIRLEKVAANPHLLYLPADAGPVPRFMKDLIARAIGWKYRKLRSSMLQSLERGRATEIRWLNGYVVEKAGAAGLHVPLNAALVRLIQEIETGRRPIHRKNLDDLLAVK